MHVQFIRETTEKVDNEKTRQWLSRDDLIVRTQAFLRAAQEQDKLYEVIRTNYMRNHIDKIIESPLCRLCGKKVNVCNT